MIRILILFLLLSAPAGAQTRGVAPQSPAQASDPGQLGVGAWLVAGFGAQVEGLEPGAPAARGVAHLSFAPGGRVSGFGGCNLIGGRMGAAASEIRIEVAPLTRRRCDPARAAQERRLIETLNAATLYETEGGRITLSNEAGALVILSQGAAPRRALAPAPRS